MTAILIVKRLKLAWCEAEKGVFWLEDKVARKYPGIKWTQWKRIL